MATQTLPKGGSVPNSENCANFQRPRWSCASQHGRICVPTSQFLCKNYRLNVKLGGLIKESARFKAWKQETSLIKCLSVCRDGLVPAEKTQTDTPTPTSEKLDEWMKNSVIEIVRHIQEAPFLHYVFDRNRSSTTLNRQRVSEDMFGGVDSWPIIRNFLRDISPDGVILVQRLNEDPICRYCTAHKKPPSGEDLTCIEASDDEGCTDMWGLMIQGRSVGVSACYILRTTQIVSANGYCTQFCLTRAKCFGPSPQNQLTNSWLL